MNDDDFAELFKRTPPAGSGSGSGASWTDVANEFQTLGESLGDALRAAWQRQDNDERTRELRDSLNSMLEGVSRVIDEGITTPEAQQAREQLTRVAESIREATARASQEVRPELLAMLRRANAELRRFSGTGE